MFPVWPMPDYRFKKLLKLFMGYGTIHIYHLGYIYNGLAGGFGRLT
jgi:hypothetical protein